MDRKTFRALSAAALIAVLAGALLLSACSSKPTIVVASKNFTEQVILGEIIAAQIERRLHVPVERKLNLGGTLLAHEALLAGSVDLYPEYTGTTLTEILHEPAQKDARGVFAAVQQGYRKLGVSLLPPLGFNNTFAMVVPGYGTKKEISGRCPMRRGCRGRSASAMSSPSGPTGSRASCRPTD